MVRKSSDLSLQNVCVVFKDIAFDPLVECKASNSLGYLFKKSLRKEGLEIAGLRMVYIDDRNREEYKEVFHHTFDELESWDRPVLALVIRGFEAVQKVEAILGNLNPETARRSQTKNLRACFGRSREDNCVI